MSLRNKILPALVATILLPSLMTALCHAQSMNGSWRVESGTIYGTAVPPHVLDAMQLDVANNQFTAMSGNLDSTGTVLANPQTSPFQITFTIDTGADVGRELKAIYEFDAGRLNITFSEDGNFPAEFNATEINRYLALTYSAGTRASGAPNAAPTGQPINQPVAGGPSRGPAGGGGPTRGPAGGAGPSRGPAGGGGPTRGPAGGAPAAEGAGMAK